MRDATERLLEALAPSLEAEIDRVIAETRQQLEEEFQVRLQTEQRDAEVQALQQLEVRLEEARVEAREAVRAQLTEDFSAHLQSTVQQLQSEMQSKADEAIQASLATWRAEGLKLQSELDRWRAFADAQRQLSESTSQTEILYRFLQLSGPFANYLAIYVSKADGLSLWQSRGGVFPSMVSDEDRDPELYFKSIVVREKVVAAICARRQCDSAALDFLISCLERAIETFGTRLKTTSPRVPVPQPANGSHV